MPPDQRQGRQRSLFLMVERPQKITFGEMREMGVRGVLIYCADYKCSHSTAVSADVCQACVWVKRRLYF
jgi:hypothetical protein